jgi:hypothetical protein
MGVTFTEIDNTDKILKELQIIQRSEIQGGFFGDKDAELPKVAFINEFGAEIHSKKAMRWLFAQMREAGIEIKSSGAGTGKDYILIPERAFMRKTFDDDNAIREVFEFGIENYNKHQDINMMLRAMGLKLVAKIQESISSNIQPANHPFTTYQKGGIDKTLIGKAPGRMRQGVAYKIA